MTKSLDARILERFENNRARWLWIVAGLTAAYGLLNVITFYTTGSFGPVWFAASLLVYTVLLVTAITVAVLDIETGTDRTEASASQTREEDARVPGATGERERAQLVDHETLYEVPTGSVIQARLRSGDHERTVLFALGPDEVLPVSAIEDRLDDVALEPPPIEHILDVDAALDRRASRARTTDVDAEGVPVEVLDHETLYEDTTGSVLEVTYRVAGNERTELFAVTADGVVPVDQLVRRLGGVELDADGRPADLAAVLHAADEAAAQAMDEPTEKMEAIDR